MAAINLVDKLATFDEHWSPRVVADFNGHDVMVAKVQGDFVWHSHPDTDDLFFVLKGEIRIDMRDQSVTLREGEMFVVPAGVEHKPYAEKEAHILIMEPAGTPNTGDPETAVHKPKI